VNPGTGAQRNFLQPAVSAPRGMQNIQYKNTCRWMQQWVPVSGGLLQMRAAEDKPD
jgi:hypothetical protein